MRQQSPHAATAVAIVLGVAGAFMLFMGWKGAAATLFVPTQLAYGVSGTIVGVALIGVGLGVLSVQATRLSTARRSIDMDAFLNDAVEVLVAMRRRVERGENPLKVQVSAASQAQAAPAGATARSGHVGARSFVEQVLMVAGGRTYHADGCRIISGAPSAAIHLTADEALAAGLAPCRICAPTLGPTANGLPPAADRT